MEKLPFFPPGFRANARRLPTQGLGSACAALAACPESQAENMTEEPKPFKPQNPKKPNQKPSWKTALLPQPITQAAEFAEDGVGAREASQRLVPTEAKGLRLMGTSVERGERSFFGFQKGELSLIDVSLFKDFENVFNVYLFGGFLLSSCMVT